MLLVSGPLEWALDLNQRSRARTSFYSVTLSRASSFSGPYFSYIRNRPEVFTILHLQRLRRRGECGISRFPGGCVQGCGSLQNTLCLFAPG